MTEQSDLERSMTLAEMAPHSSVTVGVLSGREGRFPDSRLADQPPVTYLEPSEAPAYVFTNGKRGIGLGTKRNQTTPDDDRGTVIMITGRRTLCLVGREDGDGVFDVPHRTLSATHYKTGLLANRLVLEQPRSQYHCWIDRKTDEAVLDQAVAYIQERIPETPEPVETADGNARTITYRGKPITIDETPDQSNGEEPDQTNSSGPNETSDEEPDQTSKEESNDTEQTVTYRGKEYDPSEIE